MIITYIIAWFGDPESVAITAMLVSGAVLIVAFIRSGLWRVLITKN